MVTGACLVAWVIIASKLDAKYQVSSPHVRRKEQDGVILHRSRSRRLDSDSLLISAY
jgi:hypothetical protein